MSLARPGSVHLLTHDFLTGDFEEGSDNVVKKRFQSDYVQPEDPTPVLISEIESYSVAPELLVAGSFGDACICNARGLDSGAFFVLLAVAVYIIQQPFADGMRTRLLMFTAATAVARSLAPRYSSQEFGAARKMLRHWCSTGARLRFATSSAACWTGCMSIPSRIMLFRRGHCRHFWAKPGWKSAQSQMVLRIMDCDVFYQAS